MSAGVKEGISSGKLKVVSKHSPKSDVWKRFLLVVDSNTLSPAGHVQCKECKSFLSFDTGKTGTSHLNRHKCKSTGGSAVLTSFFSEKKPAVPSSLKESLATLCVRWCAKDMRPFDVVRDEGFLKIADELVAAGARYGTLSAKELLPHPTTVSRKAAEVAGFLRERLRPEIKAAMEDGRCSMTVDMWTDDYKKIAYTTATVHYVDDNWELRNLVLFTSDFPSEKKTGDNIRRELVRRCAKLGLDESLLGNVVFVSDQGANVVSALRPYSRVSCTAHVLNTVLRHTFDDDFLSEELPHVRRQLQNVKAVVTFLKQSGLSSQLPRGVNQEVSTRWNSKLTMLNSVYTQYEEVEALLDSRGSSMMEEVSKTAIKELIDFLAPFKEATDMLEKDKQPTLPLVLLCKTKLEKHLTLVPAEAPTTAALKLRAREFLQRKLELSELHKTATFLWPPFSQLRALEEDERSAVYASVKTRMFAIPTNSLPSDACAAEICSEKPAKRRLIDDFEEWHDVMEPQKRRDELTSYLNSTEVCEDVGDLLQWWKSKKEEFPRLSQLARQILCVPATSASSERNFSAAGFVMNERRTCLKPESLDNLLFLHKNM